MKTNRAADHLSVTFDSADAPTNFIGFWRKTSPLFLTGLNAKEWINIAT